MPNGVTVKPATTGVNIQTDLIGQTHYPITKMAYGDEGNLTLVSAANPLPVTMPTLIQNLDAQTFNIDNVGQLQVATIVGDVDTDQHIDMSPGSPFDGGYLGIHPSLTATDNYLLIGSLGTGVGDPFIFPSVDNEGSLGAASQRWNQAHVGNLELTGNILSSTDIDGHIRMTPNGNGGVILGPGNPTSPPGAPPTNFSSTAEGNHTINEFALASDNANHNANNKFMKARGTWAALAAVAAGDRIGTLGFWPYTPNGNWKNMAWLRGKVVDGSTVVGDSVDVMLQFAAGNVSGGVVRMEIDAIGDVEVVTGDLNVTLGDITVDAGHVRALGGYVAVKDGMTAPAALFGEARIYVDTADGDLKVIFGDGTVKTIAVDT